MMMDGKNHTTEILVDRELRAIVKAVLDGECVSKVIKIEIKTILDELFDIPEDYIPF